MTPLETEKALLMSWISDHTNIEPAIAISKKAITKGVTFFTKQDYPDTLFSIPLEQVLEELPLMVHEEKYPRYFEQHKNSNGTTSFYYQYGGVKYLEETSDDYHLAALRLLKKIKQGEKE